MPPTRHCDSKCSEIAWLHAPSSLALLTRRVQEGARGDCRADLKLFVQPDVATTQREEGRRGSGGIAELTVVFSLLEL